MSRLADVFLDLHKRRCSGVLRIERGKSRKQLVVEKGLVACAESNQPEEHLARIMMQMRFLSRTGLAEVAKRMKSGDTTDEAILAVSKIKMQELEMGGREQAIRILASLLAWDDFAIHFYAGEGLVRRLINLKIPITRLILTAARRAASERLSCHSRDPLRGTISPAIARGEVHPDFPLNSSEAFVYSQIQDPISVDNLLRSLPEELMKPEEVIRCLLFLGLVRMERAAASDSSGLNASSKPETLEEQLRRLEVQNHYQILSVATDAGIEEIKAAYHDLAKRYHPDLFQSAEYDADFRATAESLFTFITTAYTTLSNATTRAAYDEMLTARESPLNADLQASAAENFERGKTAESLFQAGRMALIKGNLEKALARFKESVWLRPDVAKYHHYLGITQAEIPGFRKEAELNLKKAIELDKVGVESSLALGKLYLKSNFPRKAEAQFQDVLRWEPDNAEALSLLEGIKTNPTYR